MKNLKQHILCRCFDSIHFYMLLYFMVVVLTIRNGKTRPRIANNPQRWIPMMTNAASRSDWMKISLLRAGEAPPDSTGDSITVEIDNFFCV